MSVYGRILLAGLGSLALLLGALGFQYLGELAPCPMCIWQRWPHVIAMVASVLAMTLLWRYRRPLAGVAAVVVAVGAGIGAYHVGVEQRWWEGPSTCTSPDPSGLTPEQFIERLQTAPAVACDEVAWDMFGVSMAGWNALISVGLALLWLFAALPKTTTRHPVPN